MHGSQQALTDRSKFSAGCICLHPWDTCTARLQPDPHSHHYAHGRHLVPGRTHARTCMCLCPDRQTSCRSAHACMSLFMLWTSCTSEIKLLDCPKRNQTALCKHVSDSNCLLTAHFGLKMRCSSSPSRCLRALLQQATRPATSSTLILSSFYPWIVSCLSPRVHPHQEAEEVRTWVCVQGRGVCRGTCKLCAYATEEVRAVESAGVCMLAGLMGMSSWALWS